MFSDGFQKQCLLIERETSQQLLFYFLHSAGHTEVAESSKGVSVKTLQGGGGTATAQSIDAALQLLNIAHSYTSYFYIIELLGVWAFIFPWQLGTMLYYSVSWSKVPQTGAATSSVIMLWVIPASYSWYFVTMIFTCIRYFCFDRSVVLSTDCEGCTMFFRETFSSLIKCAKLHFPCFTTAQANA